MMYLYNPNGPLTVVHLADYNRLGAVVGALCGERDFTRSCDLSMGPPICSKCEAVARSIEQQEASS